MSEIEVETNSYELRICFEASNGKMALEFKKAIISGINATVEMIPFVRMYDAVLTVVVGGQEDE